MKDKDSQKDKNNVVLAPKQNSHMSLRGIHYIYYLILILFILNLVALYNIFFSSRGIEGYRQKHQQVIELEAKNKEAGVNNHNLFRRIQNAKTDPKAQERLVRETLGWVKKNEIVIEFMPKKE